MEKRQAQQGQIQERCLRDAFEAIHASASALRKVRAIDKATMRSFDETCLAALPASSPNRSLTQS
jgi:DNA-binding transcriptional regulator YiaG